MIHLSVNINKIATLRNTRSGTIPDVLQLALLAEKSGAHGITVHPRPDERHIRYADVRALKPILSTEFNIEGNPKEPKFIDLILEIKPHQVTLVPDALNQKTSDHGWDTVTHYGYLKETVALFKQAGIRTSIFVDPVLQMVEGAAETGTDRIELYTEAYAVDYTHNPELAILPYINASKKAHSLGLGVNAGHDLNLQNLAYFAKHIPHLEEVSIGHALVADALYMGLRDTIKAYRECLK
jgi:pyridoxine 5-phosphate synthase